MTIAEIGTIVGLLVIFATIIISYTKIQDKVETVDTKHEECKRHTMAHIGDDNVHINMRSWDMLSSRLERIERKLDGLNSKTERLEVIDSKLEVVKMKVGN